MKRIVLAAILATTAAAGFAYAQQDGAEMPRPALAPHRDMTRDEAKAKAMQMFAKLDVNGDGKLDRADRTAHVARMFDAMDTNHDGQISRQEFMAMHDRGPGVGRDGEPMGGPHGDHGPDGDGPGGDGPDGEHGPGMMDHDGPHGRPDGMHGPGKMHGPGDMMAMARMADTNHDGAISQAEFMAAAMKRFDEADTNHDGKLSPAERHAEHARMHDRPGGPPPPPPPPAN